MINWNEYKDMLHTEDYDYPPIDVQEAFVDEEQQSHFEKGKQCKEMWADKTPTPTKKQQYRIAQKQRKESL